MRDPDGVVLRGYEFAPTEAHRIGEALNAAAFTAGHSEE